MAFASSTSQSLFSFLLVLSICVSSIQISSASNGRVIVNDICSLTKNPSFCTSTLNSISGVGSHDLRWVCANMIDKIGFQGTDNANFIPSINATPAQKPHLSYCRERYILILRNIISNGLDSLSKDDFNGLEKLAITAASDTKKCESSFRTLPSAPSPLTKRNQVLFDLIDVLRATAIVLAR